MLLYSCWASSFFLLEEIIEQFCTLWVFFPDSYHHNHVNLSINCKLVFQKRKISQKEVGKGPLKNFMSIHISFSVKKIRQRTFIRNVNQRSPIWPRDLPLRLSYVTCHLALSLSLSNFSRFLHTHTYTHTHTHTHTYIHTYTYTHFPWSHAPKHARTQAKFLIGGSK